MLILGNDQILGIYGLYRGTRVHDADFGDHGLYGLYPIW